MFWLSATSFGLDIVSAWFKDDTTYASASGTSMATAHITGLVAYLLYKHPKWQFEDIKNQLVLQSNQLKSCPIGYGSLHDYDESQNSSTSFYESCVAPYFQCIDDDDDGYSNHSNNSWIDTFESTQFVLSPSMNPSINPSIIPTNTPSSLPSFVPSSLPTLVPSSNPTLGPILMPTNYPSTNPTQQAWRCCGWRGFCRFSGITKSECQEFASVNLCQFRQNTDECD